MAASRKDWKIHRFPAARATIALDRIYSDIEFERLCEGNIPQDMGDKWFCFYGKPWLYVHRNWTGYGIYQVRFEPVAGGARVTEVRVSRNAKQYKCTDGNEDARRLASLLDMYAGRDFQIDHD